MTAQDRTRPSKADTSKLDGGASPRLRWIEFGSTAVAFGVLAQATLAGQILTGRHWLAASHRILAEGLPVLAVALVVLAWKERAADRSRSWLLWTLSVAVVLMVGQTGLGFVGRSSPAAIAIHVPLGVGLLGIYVLVANASRNQASVQGR